MTRSSLNFVGSNGAGSKRPAHKRLYAAVLLALSGPAMALPEGGEVVAGDATIAVSGDTMQVLQNSQRAILNFQSFDIAGQQTVNFQQPNSDAVALNRVLGDRLSEIHGALNANGQVYLINPNGVVFGNGAEINVGSLVVTTLDIADQDFLAGRDAFRGAASGRVENQGSIQARDRVVLLAPEVKNTGEISVTEGEILLRSSRQALLHTAGSDIPILLDDPDLVGQVTNQGSLQAGEVALVLDGSGRRDIQDSAINNSGLVRAVRASGAGGEIHLLAGGAVVNTGALDASAEQGAGGAITIAASVINQSGTIDATAAGEGDGGNVELRARTAVAMHSGSNIDASADRAGNAGEVIVIADGATWFTEDASIRARGGELAGDGGFVEVSGHEFVSVAGSVDVGADAGEAGLWYIDPTDITITANFDSNGTFSGSNPTNWVPIGTPATALINVTTLRNTLANNGNVRISTASSGTGQGNITFEAGLNYNGLGGLRTLTLEANGSIIFNPTAFISDSDPTTVEGLNFFATAGTGFVLPNGASIFTGTGRINITATTGDVTFTGLGSSANAADAIRVTASAGRLINAGDATWDLTSNGANAGVILSARDGMDDIGIGANRSSANGTHVDASSSAGAINLFGEDVLRISRLSAANTAAVQSPAAVYINDSAVLGGSNVQVSSSQFVAVPQSGLTASGTLTLLAPDIVARTVDPNVFGRTLTLGADALVINTNAAGGNLQINSAANTLSLTNGFSNTITVNDTNALALGAIAPQAGAIVINSGAGFDLTVGTALNLTGSAGSLTLGAGRDLLLNASIIDTDGSGVTLSAPNSVIFAAGSEVNGGTGNVSITATSGNVALGRLTGGAMTVTAGGAITDANGAALNLSGTSATLSAGAGIGTLADALEGSVGTLTLTSGAAYFSNDRALNLASISAGGNVGVSTTAGNLTLGTILARSNNSTLDFTAAGALTYGGSFATTAGANNLAVNFTSGGAMNLNGQLRDAVSTSGAHNFSFTAGNGFTMQSAATVDAQGGTIAIDALAGNATITGLVSRSTAQNAVQVVALNGSIIDANSARKDIDVGDGGFLLHAMGNIGDLAVESNFMNVVSTAGNITIHEEASTSALRLETPGTASIYTGAQFSVDLATSWAVQNLFVDAGTDFRVADTGLSVAGDLTVVANNLRGGAMTVGPNVTLAATNADITLRNATAARTWNTSFDQLVLDITGGGSLSLTDTNGLTLTSVVTDGSASFTTTGADLVLTAQPQVAGDLALRTTGAGNLIVPNAGFTQAGNLLIDANDLLDTNRVLSLEAATADIRLRNPGGDHDWTTRLGSLALDMGGSASIQIGDEDGLTLTSLNVGGNATLSANNADLVFTASPLVGGDLSLTTVGAGDLVIADTGLSHGGDLTVLADNIRDSDTSIILGATNADITLRDGSLAQSWSTSFNQLALQIAGAGAFSLVDADGLSLTSVSTGGSASFSATGADLLLTAALGVGGDLALRTVSSGDVIIPNAGLSLGGDLTIDADNLRDGDADVTLAAANADIRLRDGAAARTWATSFDTLVLQIAGAGAFTLTDSNGLTLTSASTGGSAVFRTTGADLVLATGPTIGGGLTLATQGSGDVVIAAAGLSHSGDLTVVADNLRDSDNNVILAATNADITLRDGAVARAWTTSFDTLALAIAGTGAFSLVDSDSLTLTSINVGGDADFRTTAADLTLTASPVVAGDLSLATLGSGDLVIPNAGLLHTGSLTIVADNLVDADSSVTLAAADANISLRDGALAQSWTTAFDSLVLSVAGAGAFSLTDSDGLTLTSVATGGDASFRTTNADLVLAATPTVAGALRLETLGSGDLVIPGAGLLHTGNLTVLADNLLDTDSTVTLAGADAEITLRGGSQAQSWTTSFDSLVLDIAGAGAFSLTDSDGLTLSAATTGGNASFRTTNADLVLVTTPDVAGTLNLATLGSGNLIIPAAGLLHTGALTVLADNLADSDSAVTLAATSANITLRDGSLAQAWTTAFDALVLDIAGAGNLVLTDSDGLTLSSATTGGNASFRTTNADLILTATPDVGGELRLETLGSGDVVIPDTGLLHTGQLTILADNLVDSDTALTLGATTANITLRDGGLARSWATAFDALVLDIAGGGDFLLTDADGLTLTSVATGGNASFRTTDADLVLSATPVVAGELGLATLGTGDVVIPNAGLLHTGDLTISADDLRDSDADLILGAVNADITLRAGAAPRLWTTSFGVLALDIAGTGGFSLTDSHGLTLGTVTTGGSASFRSTNADLVLSAAPVVGGALSLATVGSGAVVIPNAGLLHSGDLTVDADNLRDTDADVILGAVNADITLRDGAAARSWTTAFAALVLDIAGAGDFALTDSDGLTLTAVTTGGNASFHTTAADLILAAAPTLAGRLTLATLGSGDVILPNTGLLHSADLVIDADDLRDGDADVVLRAANADIRLRNGAASRSWTTDFETLALQIADAGDFDLTDADGLTLTAVTTGGNARFRTTDADLVVTAAPAVAGDLTLATLGSGDLIIPNAGLFHTGALGIEADNVLDTDANVALGATAAAITLRGGGSAQSWTTRFDSLALTVAGAGEFALTDENGLTLTAVTTGGNASFSTTNADLILMGNPAVAGELGLVTLGSGDVVLPGTGLLHAGNLRLVADDLVGAGAPLALGAIDAAITLRGGTLAQSWATSFDRLELAIAGAGEFSLTDTDGLTLTAVNTGGNASFRTTAADLVLSSAPVVAGQLHLETLGSGDLVIPDAGLSHGGSLSLVADQVRDSDSGITLATSELYARLRDHQQAATWSTSIGQLDLEVSGGGALTLGNSGALTIDSLVSDGEIAVTSAGSLQIGTLAGTADMAFTSADDLTLLNSDYDVDGRLTLTAADELRLAAAGLSVTDGMRLNAATLSAAGGAPLVLAGTAADLTLTGSQALALSTRLSQLGLTYNGGSLSVSNDRSLVIDRLDAPNAATVGLSVNGLLTVPTTGLAAGQRLTIDAVDLRDDDRAMSFSAAELAVRLSGASGDHNWTLDAGSLDVLMRGQANLQVNASNGLVLEDLNNDARSVLVENGNFTLNLASGDLILADAISAADLTADGVRAGVIDLAVAQGDVRTRGSASLVSSNLVDQAGSGDGIRIRVTDTSAAARAITLGSETGSPAVTLRAIGGDILLDTRPAGTAAAASRNLVQYSGTTIEAFDNPGDSLTGRVLINGGVVAAQPWQTVRAGRTLAIVTDVAPLRPVNPLDQLDDLDGRANIIRDTDKSGPKAAAQFEQVFGTCDELDKKNRHRCRVDDALKSFLSHWLVGGEMPPKSEMR